MSWNRLICIAVVAFAFAAERAPAADPATKPARPVKVNLTISRVTTCLMGPVNPDGTVNYLAALNARMSRGVTPENNAAVLLVRAIGPEMFPQEVSAEALKMLKIASLPAKGDYFVRSARYFAEHASGPQAEGLWETDSGALEAPWAAKDHPLLAAWLKANAKPLALVEQASRRPRYYQPLVSSGHPAEMIAAVLPALGAYRDCARALAARAMLKAGAGDADGASADLMTVHRLARLISRGPTLIDRLVGLSVEGLACSGDNALARAGTLTAAQAMAHLAELRSLPELPDIVEVIDTGERFFGLDCVMVMARGGSIDELQAGGEAGAMDSLRAALQRRALDWDVVLLRFNYWYDRIAAVNRLPTYAQRKAGNADLEAQLSQLKASALDKRELAPLIVLAAAGDRVGKGAVSQKMADLLIAMLVPTFGRARFLQDRAAMRRRLAELALALAACKAERGDYPAELSALKPKHLTTLPADLFAEGPLRYRRVGKGYLLYSVGENGKDDGGAGRVDRRLPGPSPEVAGDDIVIRVE